MSTETWFVPGKLVLVGEYAVLDGAPAVVAAVDVGVCCTALPSDTRTHQTPGDDRFVAAALHAANAPPARYVFADWNPPDLPGKAGLGGSASATVAAFLAAGRQPWPSAAAVHRAVQGSGSGIDVAASAHGGVLRFQDGLARTLPPLDPVVVWTGRSAATSPRVAAYLSWANRADFVRHSTAVVDEFSVDPTRALREGHRLLASMQAAARVDWDTPEQVALVALASDCGGAAKFSGAGGGDVVVALLPDPDARSRFERGCAALRLPVLRARVCGAPFRRATTPP